MKNLAGLALLRDRGSIGAALAAGVVAFLVSVAPTGADAQQGQRNVLVDYYVSAITSEADFDAAIRALGPASAEAREVATYYPFWAKGKLKAKITEKPGANIRSTAGGTGFRGDPSSALSPDRPFNVGSPFFSNGLITAQTAWLPTVRFQGDHLDAYVSTNLVNRWMPAGSVPVTAADYLAGGMPVTIDVTGKPGFDQAGFLVLADRADRYRTGMTDAFKRYVLGLDPKVFSTAGDGISDAYKHKYLIPIDLWIDPNGDWDNDGVSNWDEWLNDTDIFNPDSDGDGAGDAAEISWGGSPCDASDLGLPPDDVVNVQFNLFSGHTGWEVTIRGIGGDTRTIRIVAKLWDLSAQNIWVKLRKGNPYIITARWLASGSGDPNVIYQCWTMGFFNQPGAQTYYSYTENRLPGVAETVAGIDNWYNSTPFHWFIDNADGLFTAHVHQDHTLTRGPGDDFIPLAERLTANLHILKTELQPITAETVPPPGSAIINPAVVATNGLAWYSIDVKPDTIPDSEIEWKVTGSGAGKVSFYNGNKGRSIIVRGTAEGYFDLEATINGVTSGPKPCIKGRVLAPTVTPLHFFIACDASGNPVIPSNTVTTVINNWVNRANRDFAQAAMSFTVASIKFVSNNAWLHIEDREAFEKMCSYTNNVGGLEVYVVSSLWRPAHGMTSPYLTGPECGLAVTADASPETLGHEIGHACGWDDVKTDRLGNTLVSKKWVGEDNWSGGEGTGYYPSNLKHADLVKRLLMHGAATGTQCDIPLGNVEAYLDDPYVQAPAMRAVGVNSMRTRTPLH